MLTFVSTAEVLYGWFVAWWSMKGNRLIHIFESVGRRASAIGGTAGATFIFLMMLLITMDVIGREFGKAIFVSNELSAYMLMGTVFLGLAYTQRKGRHIRIIVLIERLSPRKRQLLEIGTLILGLAFIGWLTWSTLGAVIQNYVLKTTSLTVIHTPLWIPYALFPVGLGVLGIELVIELIREIASLKNKHQMDLLRGDKTKHQ